MRQDAAMRTLTIPGTELSVSRLCLGGNVFGWSADAQASFDILDAFVEAGGTFIDTADSYSAWVPGHAGGESESIIGQWMAARGNRDRLVIATKLGKLPSSPGLSPANITACVEASLRRLGTDRLDICYAHQDDPDVPLEVVSATFHALIDQGKIRYLGASNFSPDRLRASLAFAREHNAPGYALVQDLYNLMDREPFESSLRPVLEEFGIANLPFYALARGFLTGKYAGGARIDSVRAEGASAYVSPRGDKVIEALATIAQQREVPLAAIALAWLAQQPSVATPIASARTVEQLYDLLPFGELELSQAELAALDAASSVN